MIDIVKRLALEKKARNQKILNKAYVVYLCAYEAHIVAQKVAEAYFYETSHSLALFVYPSCALREESDKCLKNNSPADTMACLPRCPLPYSR